MNVKFETIIIGKKIFKNVQLANISCEELIEFLSNDKIDTLDYVVDEAKKPEPRQEPINPIERRKLLEEQSEPAPKKQTNHAGGRPARPVRVTDLSTGNKKTFKTSTAAAEALEVNKTTVLYAIKNNSLVKNRYEVFFVDEADKI